MDLVVLSACETGLGAWNPGDGSKSLAKAFIESGTGAVVYSLWNMNDISTQKIMGYFYQYLSKGQAKDEALRNAKLSYINEFSGDKNKIFIGQDLLPQVIWHRFYIRILYFIFSKLLGQWGNVLHNFNHIYNISNYKTKN